MKKKAQRGITILSANQGATSETLGPQAGKRPAAAQGQDVGEAVTRNGAANLAKGVAVVSAFDEFDGGEVAGRWFRLLVLQGAAAVRRVPEDITGFLHFCEGDQLVGRFVQAGNAVQLALHSRSINVSVRPRG